MKYWIFYVPVVFYDCAQRINFIKFRIINDVFTSCTDCYNPEKQSVSAPGVHSTHSLVSAGSGDRLKVSAGMGKVSNGWPHRNGFSDAAATSMVYIIPIRTSLAARRKTKWIRATPAAGPPVPRAKPISQRWLVDDRISKFHFHAEVNAIMFWCRGNARQMPNIRYLCLYLECRWLS